MMLWTPDRYSFDLPAPGDVPAVAREVFPAVWRTTTAAPGFAVVRPGWECDSMGLRAVMAAFAGAFGFVAERLGRFDQQVTSRFHRDGAPPASLLVLGYEPTRVRSRVFVADAHAAAAAAGLGIHDYLAGHNPMFAAGEAGLRPWVTEVDVPRERAFVLLLNNSLLPPGGGNPLGVLHRAEVPDPDPRARRVINSMGLMPNGDGGRDPKPAAEVERFLTRDDLD